MDLTQPVSSPRPEILLGDSWHSSASSASSVSSDDGFALLEMVEAEAAVRDSQTRLESLEQQLHTPSDPDSDVELIEAVPSTRQSGRSIRPSRKIQSQLRQAEATTARDLERQRLNEAKLQLRAVKTKEKESRKAKKRRKRQRLEAQRGSQLDDI